MYSKHVLSILNLKYPNKEIAKYSPINPQAHNAGIVFANGTKMCELIFAIPIKNPIIYEQTITPTRVYNLKTN